MFYPLLDPNLAQHLCNELSICQKQMARTQLVCIQNTKMSKKPAGRVEGGD